MKQGGAMRAGGRMLALAALAAALSGCVPALMGGALVGTTVVATDRRSPGIQVEDQAIEMRVRDAVDKELGEKAQVTPSSYNRSVLLVGAVADEASKARAERIAAGQQNVGGVINRLIVGPARTVSQGANDSWISGQVRTRLIGTSGLPSNSFAITTFRGVVHLQGRVSKREGDMAAQAAAQVRGVGKVLTFYEYISEDEAARTTAVQQPAQTPAPATTGTPISELSSPAGGTPAASTPAPVDTGAAQVIPIPRAP
ncbi:BON domain-containing protein [Verticiella sediminum]|nr:BON domain-containing protein [Verticiella sediminum]